MKNLKVIDILKVTNGEFVIGNEEDICGDFCKDTRLVKNGDTYVGLKGETFDGSSIWKDALLNGATTVIVENIHFKETDILEFNNKNIIKVESTMKAIQEIAEYIRSLYNIPVIGVTGSVGKTSTKDIIANVVSQKFKTLKTEGNYNNHIGLPFTLFRLKEEEAAVVEMGMNHFNEIRKLTKIAKPTISVITNIGTSHIGNLGSRENILKAKLEILEGMENKILVLNNDNDLLHKYNLKNTDNVQIYTYGIDNKSDVMAENLTLNEESSDFTCILNEEKFKVHVPVGGIHFIYNAMCAALVGNLLGLSTNEIKNGIETFELTKKRMDIIELENGVKIINDSYNASFESMQASLKYLAGYKDNRKIAVLGDMFELGDFSDELHKKVGKEVKENNIDLLFCCGENAKNIVEGAKLAGMNSSKIFYYKDKKELEDSIKKIWNAGDVILFKASNGMRFFEIVEKLKLEKN